MGAQTKFLQSKVILGLLAASFCLTACSEDAPCGVDDEDEPIISCLWTSDNSEEEELLFCPGDHFAADDGCQSCGCGADGEVICTSTECN